MTIRKILVAVTEDWFVLSHFKPLLRGLRSVAAEVVVATRSSGRMSEIEALGCRIVPFDFRRASTNPIVEAATIHRFASLIRAERPDAVHLVALKPIAIGAAALRLHSVPVVGVHVTGLGLLSVATDAKSKLLRAITMRMLRAASLRDGARLFLENAGDRETLLGARVETAADAVILGGAGVDPAYFAPLPSRPDGRLRAAHVGRMIRSKGVDIMIGAMRIARAEGLQVELDLYGGIDSDNNDAVTGAQIDLWQSEGLARWHGQVADVRDIWRQADVFVLATRGGEGLPRALLEAAACARPAIVTNVPGCRHFVRDGIEGLIVPVDDPKAVASALQRLAADPALRENLGNAARSRVLDGYTEQHVIDAIVAAYRGPRAGA